MAIRVRYFASLKETVGRAEDCLLCDTPLTVAEIWQRLNPNIVLPETVLAAVNMDYVALNHGVNSGDEVAFFPPVTGG